MHGRARCLHDICQYLFGDWGTQIGAHEGWASGYWASRCQKYLHRGQGSCDTNLQYMKQDHLFRAPKTLSAAA